MSSITGIRRVVNNSLTQSNTLKCKSIKCNQDVSGNTIVGTPSTYLANITANVQTQINDIVSYDQSNTTTINNIQTQINNITSTATSGGGYFTVVCERVGYGTLNSPFGFGAGNYNTTEIVLPTCTLTGSRITASTAPTTGTTFFSFFKNGVGTGVSNSLAVNQTGNTVLTHNLAFTAGDTFKIYASTSGGFGTSNATVQLRINMLFSTAGVKGADGVSPTLSIGSTTTLSAGSLATVTNSGTSSNVILNFGIPIGSQGQIGITPQFNVGTITNLSSGSIPYVTVDSTSTTTNYILNFGLVQGTQGTQGTQGNQGDKGDKGDTPTLDYTAIASAVLNILTTISTGLSLLSLQTQITAIDLLMDQAEIAIGELKTEETAIKGRVSTLESEMDTVNNKLLPISRDSGGPLKIKGELQLYGTLGNQVAEFDQNGSSISLNYNSMSLGTSGGTTQIHGKLQIVDSVGNAYSTFDSVGGNISVGTSLMTNTLLGNTINMGTNTGTTNMNLKGNTINIGENLLSMVGTTVNIEANNIFMGTAGYLNNVTIGSTFSNVRIQSMTGTSISVNNFMDQFA